MINVMMTITMIGSLGWMASRRRLHSRRYRLGQISNNVPEKIPAGIFEEKEANHFF